MKKFIMLICLISFCTLGFAQKLISGSIDALAQETRLNVQIDYSEAIMDNLALDDFIATHSNWELAQTELWGKFVENLNERMSRRRLRILGGHFANVYTLVLHVKEINRKGDQKSIVNILDPEGNSIAELEVKGEGGHIGSFYNLAGDGMKSVGEILGKYIKTRGQWSSYMYDEWETD
jgi:hypothetical protein